MFAFVGYIVQSNFVFPWPQTLAGAPHPSVDLAPEAQWDAVPVGAKWQIFAVISALELWDECGGGTYILRVCVKALSRMHGPTCSHGQMMTFDTDFFYVLVFSSSHVVERLSTPLHKGTKARPVPKLWKVPRLGPPCPGLV